MDRVTDAPPGWEPSPLDEGFLKINGPLFVQRDEQGLYRLGLRAVEQHANRFGVVHGGMLATLADVVIGMNLGRVSDVVETTLTVSLTLNFIAAAKLGDWIEASATLTKSNGRVRFGECRITVADRIVMQASAAFYVPQPGVASPGPG